MSNFIVVHFQYPICDFRKLIDEHSDLKPLPNWNTPAPNKHFIQYFGHLKRRPKGGELFFQNELFYIKGKGGFKFTELERIKISKIGKIKCIYRRLISDNIASVRYEFAINFQDLGRFDSFDNNFSYCFRLFIQDFLIKIPIEIRNIENKITQTNVLNAGKYLSQLYKKATEFGITQLNNQKLVTCGEIGVFIEYDKGLLKPDPKSVAGYLFFEDENIELFLIRPEIQGKEVCVFFFFF